MIVVRLMGGLGNQLFQYATARHLAAINNTELFVDTTFLDEKKESVTPRKYELNSFNVQTKIADAKLLHSFRGSDFSTGERIITLIKTFGDRHKYKFDDYGFDEELLKLKGNYYIRGFFQSEKYFKTMEPIIRKELSLKETGISNDIELVSKIIHSESVSIHIRRGDYIRNLSAMDVHSLCSKDYYIKSIQHITALLNKDLHFYLFTDDAAWVQREMNWPINYTLIENKSTIEDFYLMSLCKHNIIANSTFSWWAAWLNNNEHKKVIMPKYWLNNILSESVDLVPKNWIVK